MIELQSVSKRFGDYTALQEVSFTIQPGEVVGFLGPNGAGKTTTMRIITGFLSASTGVVRINHHRFTPESTRLKQSIGYLPENNPLYTDLTAGEQLAYGAGLHGLTGYKRTQRITAVAALSDITDVLNKPIHTLSRGYKQRVGLAQSLLHEPDILILDEPTSGLDPNQAADIRTLIKEIGRTKTILLSSHILPEVASICTRAIIIHKGQVKAQGSLAELDANFRGSRKTILTLSGKMSEESVTHLAEDLPSLTNISVEWGENTTHITFDSSQDIRSDLFHCAVKKHLPLIELHERAHSLDDIFRELTTTL